MIIDAAAFDFRMGPYHQNALTVKILYKITTFLVNKNAGTPQVT